MMENISANKPVKNRVESPLIRTQMLAFTLFGDYVVHRGGKIWTSCLLDMMGMLGVSERAVRSTLSRMSRKGWIASRKVGRRSQYSITARGRALLDAGEKRIFEPGFTNWNNRWQLVVYSLPEKKRKKRNKLRQQLTWLGFGRLAPATWISPHNRSKELIDMLQDLDVEQYVEMFSEIRLETSSAKDLVSRCWDLAELESHYQDFIYRYQPDYEEYLTLYQDGHPLSPQDCFIRRIFLTHEFQSTPFKDPNLPVDLLPEDWIGFSARKLFHDYRMLLNEFASKFIDQIMCE